MRLKILLKRIMLSLVSAICAFRYNTAKKGFDTSAVSRVLLIEMAYLGDVICMTPVIHALKESMPWVKLDVLIDQKYAPLLDAHTGITVIHGTRTSAARGIIGSMISMRKESYDLVVCVSPGLRNALATLVSGKQFVCGYMQYHGKDTSFYNDFDSVMPGSDIVGHYGKEEHLTLRSLKSVTPLGLGFDVDNRTVETPLADEVAREKSVFLQENGYIEADKINLVIHPSASWQYKQWPIENMAKLVGELTRVYSGKLNIVLIGLLAERGNLESMDHLAPGKARILIDADLLTLMTLIKSSQLFIGNDSGPKHIAGAFNVPVLELLGPSKPETVGILNENARHMYADAECSPCSHLLCTNKGICMKSIPYAAVFTCACSMIDEAMVSLRNN